MRAKILSASNFATIFIWLLFYVIFLNHKWSLENNTRVQYNFLGIIIYLGQFILRFVHFAVVINILHLQCKYIPSSVNRVSIISSFIFFINLIDHITAWRIRQLIFWFNIFHLSNGSSTLEYSDFNFKSTLVRFTVSEIFKCKQKKPLCQSIQVEINVLH